ncbi:MAG TPA: sigma-70 family RNA polymerase sigma factor [Solirubrobacterales bacterium]|nr:sigma-70 family RNA polymerase sigma factor [Solirubrobacterales bacterium]
MEASALTHASQRGLLARRSPLLKLQGDAKLIAMARNGNTGAFETIVDRYQSRLLGFCRQMLHSTEDAEDVLQEVFVNAYRAMLADEREINLRPWLYRIARNRCLNHLRKPTADAQESMDMVPAVEAASTAEKVSNREEFRQLLTDVGKLPETQRTALLLREMDAMSYEEIAATMETSVPSVKSLLVRARISLAEASQARQLTCGEVRLELAEASEGLRKVSGPVRRHVRDCEECADFRSQVRSNDKVMAALFPAGALVAFKSFVVGKLGFGSAGSGASAGTAGGAGAAGATAGTAGATAAATGASAGAVGSVGAALSGGSAASGIGAIGGAIGTKAVAGVVTAAVITAGAVSEVNQKSDTTPAPSANPPARIASLQRQRTPLSLAPHRVVAAPPAPQPEPVELTVTPAPQPQPAVEVSSPPPAPAPAAAAPAPETGATTAPEAPAVDDEATAKAVAPKVGAKSPTAVAGAPAGSETVVVTVGGPPPPPAESAAPEDSAPPPAEESAPPPVESAPPSEEPAAESTPPPATSPVEVEAEAG